MKTFKFKKVYFLILAFVFGTVFLALYLINLLQDLKPTTVLEENFRNYHVMVIGENENQLFMEQVFNGALSFQDKYDCIVELLVPNSIAQDKTLPELIEYCGLLNVDGIIAYIDNEDYINLEAKRTDGSIIPLITTGKYIEEINQVSYVGTSWWEVGKTIAAQVSTYIEPEQSVCIVENNVLGYSNYSSLMSSLKRELKSQNTLNFIEVKELNSEFLLSKTQETDTPFVIICVTEEETLKTAQLIADLSLADQTILIGYGNSAPLMLYLNNGAINRLVCVDPQNIGERSMRQLFEYITKYYTNNYVAANIKVIKGD